MKTGIAVNDILSESSHYRVIGINVDDSVKVVHTESGDVVNIGRSKGKGVGVDPNLIRIIQ